MGVVVLLLVPESTEQKARRVRNALTLDAYDPQDTTRFYRLLRADAADRQAQREDRRRGGRRA